MALPHWTFELRVNGVAVATAESVFDLRYGNAGGESVNEVLSGVSLTAGDVITVWVTERPDPDDDPTPWMLNYVSIRVKSA